MQGSELCTLCALPPLIPTTTSCGRFSDNPHFMHEETEAQRGKAIFPRSYSSSVENPGQGVSSECRTPASVLWTLNVCMLGMVFRWVHRGRDWVPGSQGSPCGEGRCLILGPWQPKNQQLHHWCEGPSESRCSRSHHPVEHWGGAGVSAPRLCMFLESLLLPGLVSGGPQGCPRSGARGDA